MRRPRRLQEKDPWINASQALFDCNVCKNLARGVPVPELLPPSVFVPSAVGKSPLALTLLLALPLTSASCKGMIFGLLPVGLLTGLVCIDSLALAGVGGSGTAPLEWLEWRAAGGRGSMSVGKLAVMAIEGPGIGDG